MVSFNITQTGPPLGSPETAAHVHRGAIGVPGPIEFVLPPGTPKIGVYGPLTAAQMDDMRFGLHYANIHSAGFPAGEIRGQILPIGLLPLDHYQCYKLKKDVIAFPPTVSADGSVRVGNSRDQEAIPLVQPGRQERRGDPQRHRSSALLQGQGSGTGPAATRPEREPVRQSGHQTLFAKKPFVLCVPGDKTIIP